MFRKRPALEGPGELPASRSSCAFVPRGRVVCFCLFGRIVSSLAELAVTLRARRMPPLEMSWFVVFVPELRRVRVFLPSTPVRLTLFGSTAGGFGNLGRASNMSQLSAAFKFGSRRRAGEQLSQAQTETRALKLWQESPV